MPTGTTRYIAWDSRSSTARRSRRGHRTELAGVDIVPPSSSLLSDGGRFGLSAAPTIGWVDGGTDRTVTFAFWSVTGARGGAFISRELVLEAPVARADVHATAWYIPSGVGSGPPQVQIDAFDVAAGDFVDDDFVNVSPDAGLTANANEMGIVPTNSLEHIVAFPSIHSVAVPFDDWLVVVGRETVSGQDLQAAALSIAIAFAFYRTPTIVPVVVEPISLQIFGGIRVDGAGVIGGVPHGGWEPLLLQIATGFAAATLAGFLRSELQSAALDVAAKQVLSSAQEAANRMGLGFVPNPNVSPKE